MKKVFLISILFTLVSSVFAQTVPGIFLQENGWLWSEKEDGVMSAKVKLAEVTELQVYSESKDAPYEGAEKNKTLK